MKIVQNARFRSCAACFGQIAFLSVKVVKIVTLAVNSLQKRENGALSMKIVQNARFQVMRRRFCPNRIFWGSNFSNTLDLSQILFKTGKQCAFHENCTTRSFQVMRSTFWPNRIFERQWVQNRHTGLKFSSKRENSAPFMKIVQNALFRSCAALFAKSHFWASKLSKSSHWPQILFKTGKQCAFHENCTKRSFQVIRSTFWPNRILERQSCQNRHTGLKFSPKRGNSALFMKIVQNARFRSCAARFGEIAF